MTLQLTVDGTRWREHLRSVLEQTPGLVPVAKGNGYGFTVGRLARRAEWLGCDTLAVGTYGELEEAASRFHGDLLVLTPWRPYEPTLDPALSHRVIHTVSRSADLGDLLARQPGARVVLERMTSMRRHGLAAADLWALAGQARNRARLEGVAIHLPMGAQGANLAEARALMTDIIGAGGNGTVAPIVWVSHLTATELATLRHQYADLTIRPRVGTGLWLGDRGALEVTAVVQDVHPIHRGDTFGYRGRSTLRSGHLIIASGGTAHGLGLTAPNGAGSLRARANAAARGGLDAVGLVRSPYFLDGQQLVFAEPPHMQASMLLLPHGARVPEVGERIPVRVRYTTTTFDEIIVD
ncbi:alanine racemase [Nocardioides sp. BP30]|uniref:alanine racemase n=1 Tax=Nocardioides sp. BP30 TaxID=3036374 RepID=UPI00246868A2|nr:alanine racemase [Nocardioides sp. BP30]WGL52531.1 alanine racemase [Nocardioides sp. BP30]